MGPELLELGLEQLGLLVGDGLFVEDQDARDVIVMRLWVSDPAASVGRCFPSKLSSPLRCTWLGSTQPVPIYARRQDGRRKIKRENDTTRMNEMGPSRTFSFRSFST